ncbi:hypothetical protein [Sedimentitalea sp.]|uniref:hypothetical protein n=1 Tax=Sedimentitalea sp. TaxID=2048915 RepID=UPI00329A3B9E
MIRTLILFIATGALASCAQYREPKANCFHFVSHNASSMGCDFVPLGGPLATGIANE